MKKGFTLMELLGVVTILGILALVLFPLLFRQINNARSGISEANKLLVIDAAKDYVEDNINNYKKIQGISYCIDFSSLDKYLLDLKDDSLNDIDKSKKIKVTYNNKFDYDIVDSCTYSLTRDGIEVPILDSSDVSNGTSGLYLASASDADRFIYRGGEPNNYIWLDENGDGNKADSELYRIISFENDGTIKVVRDKSIGSKSFDERDSSDATTGPRHNTDNTFCNYSGTYYGCNVWGNLSNTFYNGSTLDGTFNYKYYDNNTDTQLTNSSNTGTVTVDSTLNQYLNNTWITDKEMSKYIDNHDFNVGGVYYTSSYTGGDKGLQKEESEEKLYTWNGKIGLMNITDYVETSLNTECTSVYSNFYYNSNYYYKGSQHITGYDNWPCSNRTYNWLPKAIFEWSLSPNSNNRNGVWFVHSAGFFEVHGFYAYSSVEVRPAFYLKSNIVLEGDGSSTNPYKIKG